MSVEASQFPDGEYTPFSRTELIAELRRLREESRWISVTERLPENDGPVLGVVNGEVRQRYFSKKVGFLHDRRAELSAFGTVTHWRPLPKPPEVKP